MEVIEEDGVQELLRDNYINIGKLPASCSGTTQASDVGSFFKASKKRLANMCSKDWENANLRRAVEDIVSKHHYTSAKRKNVVNGILKVIATSKKTVTTAIVENGYAEIGLFPFSLATIMSSCTKKVSVNEFQTIESALPGLVAIFKSHGQITEEEFDQANIASDGGETGRTFKQKDQRALSRQRAVNLTHPQTVERYRHQKNKHAGPDAIVVREEITEHMPTSAPATSTCPEEQPLQREESQIPAETIPPFVSRSGRPLKRKLPFDE